MKNLIILIAGVFMIGGLCYGKELKEISYPYTATEKRIKEIKTGYLKVKKGMSARKVVAIMGKPDEERSLYRSVKKGRKAAGTTHWYLIQRLKKSGSVNERAEMLVRISYNLKMVVVAVDHWGFR